MVAKTIFWYCAIVLIYANKRENDGVNLIFFFFFFFFFLRQKKLIQ